MKNIRHKLCLATCGLLSQNATAIEIDNAWEVDTSGVYYSEQDRVTVYKAVADVKGIVSTENTANLKVVFDTMSGPTPSGSVQQTQLTFTGASGGSIAGGAQTPSLAEFDDTRVAVALDWSHEFDRLNSISYSGAFSVENDYRSFSAAATFKKSTENKAYEFSYGIAGTTDQLFVVGTKNTPVPLSEVSDGLSFEEGTKNTMELLAGVTHIVNRRTTIQLNLVAAAVNGYLNDPYKIFSLVDGNGIEYDQFFESRPNSRKRGSLTFNLNHQLYPSNNILNASYRFYADDWEVKSHTLDVLYRINLSERNHLIPHFRIYAQQQASFYTNAFTQDPTLPALPDEFLPEHVSADYRLDDMLSFTIGLTLGQYLSGEGKLRSRIEYIQQDYENSEFETNKSIVFQISYSKKF